MLCLHVPFGNSTWEHLQKTIFLWLRFSKLLRRFDCTQLDKDIYEEDDDIQYTWVREYHWDVSHYSDITHDHSLSSFALLDHANCQLASVLYIEGDYDSSLVYTKRMTASLLGLLVASHTYMSETFSLLISLRACV